MKHNTRAEKIQLLKDLEAGKIELTDIQDKDLVQFVGYPGKLNEINGKEVSNEVFRAEMERQIKQKGTTLKVNITYGNEK